MLSTNQLTLKTVKDSVKIDKILILGNSITRHRPKADIGWMNDWGMAASALEKDYAHLLLQKLCGLTGQMSTAIIENIAAFEREYATYNINEKFKSLADFCPDVIVLAIGENVQEIKTTDEQNAFRLAIGQLLKIWTRDNNPSIFVRSCFWSTPSNDDVLRQVCIECHGTFVDIGHLGENEMNYAYSERGFDNIFVGRHPGDRGMEGIAEAITAAIAEKLHIRQI